MFSLLLFQGELSGDISHSAMFLLSLYRTFFESQEFSPSQWLCQFKSSRKQALWDKMQVWPCLVTDCEFWVWLLAVFDNCRGVWETIDRRNKWGSVLDCTAIICWNKSYSLVGSWSCLWISGQSGGYCLLLLGIFCFLLEQKKRCLRSENWEWVVEHESWWWLRSFHLRGGILSFL